MARKPEEVEAAIELARAAGVSEALLERMGGYTGCVGVLDTSRPGPVTTLRFDIDCLAIEELFDAIKLDQKTLEATFARYNELTQPARTPTSAVASTRKQSRSAKRPSTSPKGARRSITAWAAWPRTSRPPCLTLKPISRFPASSRPANASAAFTAPSWTAS